MTARAGWQAWLNHLLYAFAMDQEPSGPSNFRAANLITTAGAACGLAAIVFVARGSEALALSALMLAVLCDKLDGLVARKLKQSSDFGRELDSLADAVSFLVAPAVIVVLLSDGQALPCLMAGIFALAGLWRLAQFNLSGMVQEAEEPTFRGLPTTIAGAWFILLWAGLRHAPLTEGIPWVLAVFLLAMAPLMLSSLRIRKNGLLVKSLYVLLLPTLVAAWWPI